MLQRVAHTAERLYEVTLMVPHSSGDVWTSLLHQVYANMLILQFKKSFNSAFSFFFCLIFPPIRALEDRGDHGAQPENLEPRCVKIAKLFSSSGNSSSGGRTGFPTAERLVVRSPLHPRICCCFLG